MPNNYLKWKFVPTVVSRFFKIMSLKVIKPSSSITLQEYSSVKTSDFLSSFSEEKQLSALENVFWSQYKHKRKWEYNQKWFVRFALLGKNIHLQKCSAWKYILAKVFCRSTRSHYSTFLHRRGVPVLWSSWPSPSSVLAPTAPYPSCAGRPRLGCSIPFEV